MKSFIVRIKGLDKANHPIHTPRILNAETKSDAMDRAARLLAAEGLKFSSVRQLSRETAEQWGSPLLG